MSEQIKLVQSPIIAHKLHEAGKKVSKRIEDLEIDKQIATIETIKSLKDLRAELNKELFEFEEQRKLIKQGVNNPYNEFEAIYKVEISEKYKSAIETLKDKIDFVETKIKSEKKQSVESYFNELCIAEKIDFISFDKLGLEINLSTTEKKYKEQVYEFISKVNDDLKLISSMEYEAEILTEYKSTLNVSNAITSVKMRKENEARETARLKAQKIQNRKNDIIKLQMQFVEITNAFEYNEDIYISVSDIENLSDEEFISKYSELQVKIKNLLLELEKNNAVENNSKTEHTKAQNTTSAPVSAPTIEKEAEPLKKASFEVTATMAQLRALGEYMKKNNISYKNI